MAQLLAELDRLSWKSRVYDALKDGCDLEGSRAVLDAVRSAIEELEIEGQPGAPAKEPDRAILAAARRYLGETAVTKVELARIARMEYDAFRKMCETPRWVRALMDVRTKRSAAARRLARIRKNKAGWAVRRAAEAGEITIEEAIKRWREIENQ